MCLTSGVGFGAVGGRMTSGRRAVEVNARRTEGLNLLRAILQFMQIYDVLEAMEEAIWTGESECISWEFFCGCGDSAAFLIREFIDDRTAYCLS